MYDFNEKSFFLEDDRDMTDYVLGIFLKAHQARKRNEAWVQTKSNQRSEQGQERINLLKEQAEDIEYEKVHC